MNNGIKPSFKFAASRSKAASSFAFTAEHGVAALGGGFPATQTAVANLMRQWDPDLYLFGGGSYPHGTRAYLDSNFNVWNPEIGGNRIVAGFGINELDAAALNFAASNSATVAMWTVTAASVGPLLLGLPPAIVNVNDWPPPFDQAPDDTGTLITPGYVVDGYTTQNGDLILAKNQVNPIENGVWEMGYPTVPASNFNSKAFNLATVVNGVQNGHAGVNQTWATNPQDEPLRWYPFPYNGSNYPGGDSWQKWTFLPSLKRYFFVVRNEVTFWFLDCGVNLLGQLVEEDGNGIGSRQYEWFKRSLKKSTTPWNVVILGSPGQSSASSQSRVVPAMAWDWQNFGMTDDSLPVDLVLTGGPAIYERVMVDNVPVVTCGLGGQTLGGISSTPISGSAFTYNTSNGAVRLSVNDTELKLWGYASSTSQAFDFLQLTKRQPSMRATWRTS